MDVSVFIFSKKDNSFYKFAFFKDVNVITTIATVNILMLIYTNKFLTKMYYLFILFNICESLKIKIKVIEKVIEKLQTLIFL